VREVLDGRAILVGPRGTVKVAQGESLPDIGQVQAIIKSGQRWIVSTTKGVIPPR